MRGGIVNRPKTAFTCRRHRWSSTCQPEQIIINAGPEDARDDRTVMPPEGGEESGAGAGDLLPSVVSRMADVARR